MNAARIAAVAAGLLALAALSGVARPERATSAATVDDQNGVTVSGAGAIATTPDHATFSFGVVTKGRTASEALAANAAEARKVIAALAAAGIDRKDLQTETVSISPRTSDDGETILGYTATNSVSAVLRSLDRAGATIDAAVKAGANQVSGPALEASDRDRLYRDALKAAIADARAKAQVLAVASGRALGRVQTVIESSYSAPVVMEKAADTAASPPIEPGTQEIQATVTVTFALQ
jgi:uncharacterized protein YggE